MPYTPPARSPASSGTVSPTYTRSQATTSSPTRTPNGRPNLPRSANSATYLQKSRRSPAYSVSSQASRTDSGKYSSENEERQGLSINPSLRQSPPPRADSTQIPPGAIISPPDSTQNSSDDEDNGAGETAPDFLNLQEDVRRTLEVNRDAASPNDDISPTSVPNDLKLETLSALANHARMSPPARKISHCRSATEGSFFERRGSSSSQTTTDSDDEDDTEMGSVKPPLLRKKSGELVKPAIRPSSRRRHSSMPGTPTYSKAVHFNDQIEQVRHFLQVDRPIAVSAGGSPVELYDDENEFPFKTASTPSSVGWEIRLANFPRSSLERVSMPVRLQSVELSPDQKNLIGVVAVANISFHKVVVARFTLDYWKTTSEVAAEYSNDPRHKGRDDGCDCFAFTIKLSDQANLETRTLLLCVRYSVNGQELWDSNEGQNYQVDFVKKLKPTSTSDGGVQAKTVPQVAARPIPRSRHNSNSSTRGRSLHTLDDDFSSAFDDSTSNIRFRSHNQSVPSMPTTPPPTRRLNPNGQQFGVRYDFGASLSAALSQAQAQLGERSGIKFKRPGAETDANPSRSQGRNSQPPINSALSRPGVAARTNSGVESPRPEALLANKQSLDSRAYQEFVSKFCFFGSGKTPARPDAKQLSNGVDGAQDELSPASDVAGEDAKEDSARLTIPKQLDSMQQSSLGLSPNSSSSSSPDATKEPDASPRASSPPSYGFPFHHEGRHILFSEAHTPTAIQG